MAPHVFQLDLNEKFPRLARPPIVEAAIHWQARAKAPWEPEQLRHALQQRLPDYPQCAILHEGFVATKFVPSQPESIEQNYSKRFQGFRLTAADGRHVLRFTRDGVVHSQVKDYEHWEAFRESGETAWRVYCELAQPDGIQRLSVRYINHFPSATAETLGDILYEPPTRPEEMPLSDFVYQSTFTLPDHCLGVRIIKVMQPSTPQQRQSSGLFLDLEVYSTDILENDPATLADRFGKMRWLKNKVFFTLLKPAALKQFE